MKKAISAQLDYYGLLQPYGGELSYPVVEDIEHHYYSLRRNVVETMQKERNEEFQAALDKAMIDDGSADDEKRKFIIPRR